MPLSDEFIYSLQMLKVKVNIGTAARALGYSVGYTRQLDAALQPEREPNGYRSYDLERLQAFLAERERKAAK